MKIILFSTLSILSYGGALLVTQRKYKLFLKGGELRLAVICNRPRYNSLFFFAFTGATPFPLLFGLMFDQVCLVWQETCDDEQGSCWIYDNRVLGKRLMYMIITVKTISTFGFFISFLVYKPPKDDLDSDMSESIDISSKGQLEADARTVDTMLDPESNVKWTASYDIDNNHEMANRDHDPLGDSSHITAQANEPIIMDASDTERTPISNGNVPMDCSYSDTTPLTNEHLTIHSTHSDNESSL